MRNAKEANRKRHQDLWADTGREHNSLSSRKIDISARRTNRCADVY